MCKRFIMCNNVYDSFVKGQHVDLQFLIKVPMKEYLLAVSISKSICPGFLAWN